MEDFKYKNQNENAKKRENSFAVLPKYGALYIRKKIEQINSTIQPDGFFEKITRRVFKNIYQEKAQKTALSKFSEISEIALQLSKKKY